MQNRTILGTTLTAIALSLMTLSACATDSTTQPVAATASARFNYIEEGHAALPLKTMSAAEAAKLAAGFTYSEQAQVIPQDVAYALMQKQGAVVVDVREPNEYAAGHVVGAYNVPKGTVTENADLAALKSQKTPIMVYCRSGGRAGEAMKALSENGFSYVMSIGGVLTWPYGLTTEPTTTPMAETAAQVTMQH